MSGAPGSPPIRIWTLSLNQQNAVGVLNTAAGAGIAIPPGTIDPVHLAVTKAAAVTFKIYGYDNGLQSGQWLMVDTVTFSEASGAAQSHEVVPIRGAAGFQRLQSVINAVTIPTGSQNYVNTYFGFIG